MGVVPSAGSLPIEVVVAGTVLVAVIVPTAPAVTEVAVPVTNPGGWLVFVAT